MSTNASQMAGHPLPEPGSRSEKLLSSQLFASLCYWSALGLVIAAGTCLIATPPWIVELGAPAYVAVVMGHAIWNALHGRRSWRYVVAAGMMVAVVAAGKGLQAFIK